MTRLLIDTHVFIWLRFAPEKISSAALTAYKDSSASNPAANELQPQSATNHKHKP